MISSEWIAQLARTATLKYDVCSAPHAALIITAALEAMRNPTKAMIEAAWADALAEDAIGVWRSMINAALIDCGEQ